MSKVLIASLGFDERHVIRSLLRIGFSGLSGIILLIPNWDIDSRTRRAIEEITRISRIAGLSRDSISIYRVCVNDLYNGLKDIISLFRDVVRAHDRVYVSLGGGLRVLVVMVFLSILMLDKVSRRKITVIIDLETGDNYVTIDPSIPIDYIPLENEVVVLRMLMEKPMTFKELLEKTGIPRTTLWKTLSKLQGNGFIKQENNQYMITDNGRIILAKQAIT